MLFGIEVESEFYDKYLFFYIDRFVYTSIEVENDNNKDIINNKKKNLLNAFKYVLKIKTHPLTIWEIQNIGLLINENEDISGTFRKINVSAGAKAIFTPVSYKEIINRLYYLLDCYKNIWCSLDVFEREAMFHIQFMRIHPFEDGNKRTAKTILNRNLIYQNKAPVIIEDEETDLYYKFINEEDYIGFAEFIRNKSENELTTMVGLYKMLNKIPINAEIDILAKKKEKEM